MILELFLLFKNFIQEFYQLFLSTIFDRKTRTRDKK